MDTDTAPAVYAGDGEFRYVRKELCRRTAEVTKRFPLFAYVLVAILGLGGLGIWTEVVKIALAKDLSQFDGVFTAVAAFFPAVVGSATFQLLLFATGTSNRIITALGILVLFFSFGGAVLLGVFHSQYPISCLIAAIFLVVFSIWIWIVTNADDPLFQSAPVDAASGGNTSRNPKGDLSNFKAD
ncbi:MAG: hypothetical protein F4X40_03025 [Chloroflexi bacterium]|nr:hypothetical protein [Chloroflexota bacterium]